MAAARAIRAALAAASCGAARALHAALRGQLQGALGPSGGFGGAAAKEVPSAVETELENRKRELDRIQDDAADVGAVALVKQRRLQNEKGMWLSGKKRQALSNYFDAQYLGFMEIGGQTIAGIFDTGSHSLVVFSDLCKTCGQAARYNPALSAHHTQGEVTYELEYGSGTVATQEAFDMVSVGPYAPRNQSLWEVADADMQVLATSAFQAIVGLGPPEAPAVYAEEDLAHLRDNMSSYIRAGLPVPVDLVSREAHTAGVAAEMRSKATMLETFESRMFSVCIGRQPNSNGYLVWDDTAPLVKPEYFQRLQVFGNRSWSMTLDEPTLTYNPAAKDRQLNGDDKYEGRMLGCETGCAALLDSGTSLLALPGSVINALVQLTLEAEFNCSDMWQLPSIKVTLGGHEVILPPDTYISEVASSLEVPEHLQSFVRLRRFQRLAPAKAEGSQDFGPWRGSRVHGSWRDSGSQRPGASCELMVMEATASSVHGPLWILGLPFFRQYYTTFEVSGRSSKSRAVHIAKASDTCHPAPPDENPKFPPREQLYKRLVNPSKLWVAPSTYSQPSVLATSTYEVPGTVLPRSLPP
ncbi:unnamed protein product [Prorocentrum cordatum]|uniref:Peptidase A1 domain-containing protein n=1 Tax=Prorocentrum cordatum TaxID=2364126 RepID=A0ABN9PEQ6_9DINO|nr:unnamed protein product [Polarella glacialis]